MITRILLSLQMDLENKWENDFFFTYNFMGEAQHFQIILKMEIICFLQCTYMK